MDTERARELLNAERERIERELARLVHPSGEEAPETDEFDAANRATELYQDELDQGRAEDLRAQLERVGRAEQRLADGTYGLSVESGDPIPDERLEAEPTAELTVDEERARPGSA
jgi:DnaK suppressor protein